MYYQNNNLQHGGANLTTNTQYNENENLVLGFETLSGIFSNEVKDINNDNSLQDSSSFNNDSMQSNHNSFSNFASQASQNHYNNDSLQNNNYTPQENQNYYDNSAIQGGQNYYGNPSLQSRYSNYVSQDNQNNYYNCPSQDNQNNYYNYPSQDNQNHYENNVHYEQQGYHDDYLESNQSTNNNYPWQDFNTNIAPYTLKINKEDLLDLLFSNFIENHKFFSCNNILMLYHPYKGYYMPTQKQDFEVFLKKHSDAQLIHRITKNIAAELYTTLLSQSMELSYEEIYEKTNNYINFSDCVYCINQNEFISPKPNLPFLNCIDIKIEDTPNIRPTKFLEFLDSVTLGDKELKSLLIELGGYLLTDKNNIKSGFFFVGPSNTGKSTYLSLLTKILGSNNVSSIPLHDLNGKFDTIALFGMKANIASEIKDSEISDIATYKKLTGGSDFVKGERKYQDVIKFIPKAKLVFAANTLPKIKNETSDAIYSRFMFIPFEHVIREDKRLYNIEELLIAEAPLIIKLFLQGLNTLIKNNYKLPQCKRSEDIFNRFIVENNSLKYFFENYVEVYLNAKNPPTSTIDDFRVSKMQFLNAYSYVCAELSISPFDFNYIKDYLLNTYGIPYKRLKLKRNSNSTMWGFDGIRLKNINVSPN